MAYTNVDLVAEFIGASAINSTTSPTEDAVTSWIKQATDEIEARTGQYFEPQSFTQELVDWDNEDDVIRLEYAPIISISSFEYNDQAAGETPSWTAKTEDTDFYVYEDYGEIEIVRRKFSPKSGKNRFRISGTYGTSIVPARIKGLATKMVAKKIIDSVITSQAKTQGGSVSIGTIRVSDPTMFSPSVSKRYSEEISDEMSRLVGDFKTYRLDRI